MTALRTRTLFAILLVAYITFSPAPTRAADASCHPITDEERAALKEISVDIPASGQFCEKDKELIYGAGCPSDPKAYLLTKSKQTPDHVQGLNADFACRLYKFLKAADAAGKNITLNSGYRSVERQRQLYGAYVQQKQAGGSPAPVAPPGRSKHNYGIAYDLHFDGRHSNFNAGSGNTSICIKQLPSCKWAHDNAAQFGLKFPMLVEPWHIEPGTAVKGSDQLPADTNYWSSDSGTTYSGTPIQSYQSLPTPNLVPSIAPVGTPTNTATPSQTPSSQSQSQICTPSFSCSGGVVYYKTTQCTTQTYQVCAYGCNGNACATSSSTASTLGGVGTAFSTTSSSTNSNTNTNDNTDTEQPLVSDYLDQISGFTATAVDIGTSSPITFRLDPATGDIIQVINGTERPALVATSGIISTVQPTLGQQTFSSGDLSSSGYYPQPQATALQSVLSGMRSALEWALGALRSLRR